MCDYGMKDPQEKGRLLARRMMDDRGQASERAVDVVVGLTVAGLVAAFLLPIAINEIVNVSTTNWSSGAADLWDILDVIVVLGLFLYMITMATDRA
jgi:hypothetical protein